MKNFIQNGKTITLTAPHDLSSGDALLVNALFGVACSNALAGEEVETTLEGVFDLPKKTEQQVDQGAKLYWDNTNRELTTTASGNTRVGASAKAAGPAEASVAIRINGFAG